MRWMRHIEGMEDMDTAKKIGKQVWIERRSKDSPKLKYMNQLEKNLLKN